MHPLDRIKNKNQPQISVALLRMKPMSHDKAQKEAMSMDPEERDMAEEAPMREEASKDSYDECPKCAKYQMLIGEALAYYMQNKDDSEEKPDTSEVENEIESEMDSEKM